MDEGLDEKFVGTYYDPKNFPDNEEPFFHKKFDSSWVAPIQQKLTGRKLQVIVKMSNIVLTPDNPTYEGGEWHLEGTRNEDMIATGLYYYDIENISRSLLNFRTAVEQAEDHGQDSGRIFSQWFESKLSKETGFTCALKDRCIAFANYQQHQIQPFSLTDGKSVGQRKVLAFFLVNPDYEKISTSRVPPQQKSWDLPILQSDYVFGSILPAEVVALISGFLGDSLSLEEAKTIRLEFIKERGKFVREEGNVIYERKCNLCEH
jgi:hypothetical protein